MTSRAPNGGGGKKEHAGSTKDLIEDIIPPGVNTGCSDATAHMPGLMGNESFTEILRDQHEDQPTSRRMFAEFIDDRDIPRLPAPMVPLRPTRHSLPTPDCGQLANQQAPSTSHPDIEPEKVDVKVQAVLAIMAGKQRCRLVDEVTGEAINGTKAAGKTDPVAVKKNTDGSRSKILSEHSETTGGPSRSSAIRGNVNGTTNTTRRVPQFRSSASHNENVNVRFELFKVRQQLLPQLDEVLWQLLSDNPKHVEKERNSEETMKVFAKSGYKVIDDLLKKMDSLLGAPRSAIRNGMKIKSYVNVFDKKKTRWMDKEIEQITNLMQSLLLPKIKMLQEVLPGREPGVFLVETAMALFEVTHLFNAITVEISKERKWGGESATSKLVDKWIQGKGNDIISMLQTEKEQKRMSVDTLRGKYLQEYEQSRQQTCDSTSPRATSRLVHTYCGYPVDQPDGPTDTVDQSDGLTDAEYFQEVAQEAEEFIKHKLTVSRGALLNPPPAKK